MDLQYHTISSEGDGMLAVRGILSLTINNQQSTINNQQSTINKGNLRARRILKIKEFSIQTKEQIKAP